MLTESPSENSCSKSRDRSSRKLKLLAILTLSIASVALLAVMPAYEKSSVTQERTVSTSLRAIRNDPYSWINKEVSVEGRLYAFWHPGIVFVGAIIDYVLIDSNNTQMPISSNGIDMPLSWLMGNVTTVSRGVYSGPYVNVTLDGIVKETKAPDLGFFTCAVSAVYILALNVTTVNN